MDNNPKNTANIQLSVIITAHAEGVLLHKTLASVEQAAKHLAQAEVAHEILIHADNPTEETQEYLQVHQKRLKDYAVFVNGFGDLGSSRNFAVSAAHGKYVTFIDADDLMSEFWLARAYEFLESHEFGQYVAHTERTLEFGGANALIIKHGETDTVTDTLLSVYSNRWNSIIMAPRQLLLEEPFTPNSRGFGYEDWQLNCRFIARGIHNVLIAETVIFVRRKQNNSEWLRQVATYSLLRANPLLSFGNIRDLPLPDWEHQQSVRPYMPKRHIRAIQGVLAHTPRLQHHAKRLYSVAKRVRRKAAATPPVDKQAIPAWLIREWRKVHGIEKQLFPSDTRLATISLYDSFTPEHFATGLAYKRLVNHTTNDSYDYLLFVPWLTTGGADLVTLNYANTLAELRPGKRLAVIATLDHPSEWSAKLAPGIDFIPFGSITHGLARHLQFRLLEQFIENSRATHLHVLNSQLAYEFIESHQTYLQATSKHIIATSFSQSTDTGGEIFGYSHTHVPAVYGQVDCLTTDNEAVRDMWIEEYGFDPGKIYVHYQPVLPPKLHIPHRPVNDGALRILWAARVSPEKQPELVARIGGLLAEENVSIDMYGHPDAGFDQSFLRSLPPNVHYKGPFDGFFNLPLASYDAYLYTSLFDGMPNAVLEAASARLPIVSSAIGGVPGFIADGYSGRLVHDHTNAQPYAKALRELSARPKLLKEYSDHLFETLQQRHAAASYMQAVEVFAQRIKY